MGPWRTCFIHFRFNMLVFCFQKRWEVLISWPYFLALRFVKTIFKIFWELSEGPEAVIHVRGFKIAYHLHQKWRFTVCKIFHIIIKPDTAAPAGKYLTNIFLNKIPDKICRGCPNYITGFFKKGVWTSLWPSWGRLRSLCSFFFFLLLLYPVYPLCSQLVPGSLEACPSLSHWQLSPCEVFI